LKPPEAEAVIAALERGEQFSFESYYAGTREVLEYDRVAGCFVHTVKYAYYEDRDERYEYTREVMAVRLREGWEYGSFGLGEGAKR
jgi:hypothetical protein